MGALKLPEMRCVEVVCGADAFEAATPGAVESGDPARCAAVRGEAAADAAVAEFVGFEAAPTACGDAPVPEELGALCAFLASASAGYLTGQNILIDGGAFRGAF